MRFILGLLAAGCILLSFGQAQNSWENSRAQFYAAFQQGDTAAAKSAFRQILDQYPQHLAEIGDDLEGLYGNFRGGPVRHDTLILIYRNILAQQPSDPGKWHVKLAFQLHAQENIPTEIRDIAFEQCFEATGYEMPLLLLDFWIDLRHEMRTSDEVKWVRFFCETDKYLIDRGTLFPSSGQETDGLRLRMHRLFRSTAPDCAAIAAAYRPAVMDQSMDILTAQALLGLLVHRGCDEQVLFEYAEARATGPEQAPVWDRLAALGRLNMGFPQKFAEHYELAAAKEVRPELQAACLVQIAQAYRMKGDYRSAKDRLDQAIDRFPSWGEPYLHLADLLIAGSDQCPFNSFDQKAVYWVASDYCLRAKNMDPSSGAAADRRLFEYRNHLPTEEEISFRGFSAGDTYPLRCWMNLVTTVRLPW